MNLKCALVIVCGRAGICGTNETTPDYASSFWKNKQRPWTIIK
jgi:hypothetical protein